MDVGREAPDCGREPDWSTAGIGDGTPAWAVCEPIVHVAAAGPRGGLVAADEPIKFAPAIIEAPTSNHPTLPEYVEAEKSSPSLQTPCPVAAPGRIEIVLLRGRRVIVDDRVDVAVLARVIAVLER